jgi:hypothetical protein
MVLQKGAVTQLCQKLVVPLLSRSASGDSEPAATSPPILKQVTEHKRKLEDPTCSSAAALLHDPAKNPKSAYRWVGADNLHVADNRWQDNLHGH